MQAQADPIKNIVSVKIGISCASVDGPYQEMIVAVAADGTWEALFNDPGRCGCDSEIFITAVCHNDADCEADPFQTRLNCIICPIITFGIGGDDVVQPQQITCDSDGTVLINIHFPIFNPSAVLIAASVNCGPGGTEVVGGIFQVPPGTSLFVDTVICRYNPTITPNPTPFIEFFNPIDNIPLGCPSFPITIGPLPDCNNVCPTMVVLEVRDSSDTIVDPDGVHCLESGSYKVRVIVPAFVPGMSYTWSTDVGIQPGNLQEFIVSIAANEEVSIGVAVFTSIDCPIPSNHVDLKGCVDNCPESTSIEVRNASGDLVNLQVGCLPPGDYALSVTPAVPSGTHTWVVGGNVQSTNQGQTLVGLPLGQTVEVSVSKNIPGCAPLSASLNLVGCETETPPGNGSGGGSWDWLWELFNCNTLLIAAISALVIGGLTVVLGVCTGIWQITLAGGIMAFVGALLFAAWLKWCRSTTSCDLMGTIRCLLSWLVAIATVGAAAALVSWYFNLAEFLCAGAALGSGAGWGLALALITDTMAARNCNITPCLLPVPNPAPENVGAEQ